jgi:hypothetical protein
VYNAADAVAQWAGSLPQPWDPCSGETPCSDAYHKRLDEALSAFGQCMKDSAPPISLWNVACIVGCVPFLAASPLAYAACVVACNIGVTAVSVIDTSRCSNELENETEGAKASYCSCLDYQQQNCPGMAEPEDPSVGGCP